MERKLHIGCFNQPSDGWHNTDITPHIWLSRIPLAPQILNKIGLLPDYRLEEHRAGIYKRLHYLNITRRFPYPDHFFKAAFCSHVLEHIHPSQVSHVFSEVLRVLQPRGIFRAAVPSLERAISLYSADNPDECLKMIYEHDNHLTKNHHQWMYTEASLAKVFRNNGFESVTVCKFRQGRLPDVDKIDNRPENSIYVEGCKSAT